MLLFGILRQINSHSGHLLRWQSAAPALLAFASGICFAEAVDTPSPSQDAFQQVAGQTPEPLDYSDKTDVELTGLGARWDELSQPERDALLREVKLRMAQRRDPDGVLMIRTQRRYGRIYRSEGRYLKIETQVVRVRPADPNAQPDRAGTQEFGVGFEQRSASVGGSDVNTPEQENLEPGADAGTTPLLRVNQPSQ